MQNPVTALPTQMIAAYFRQGEQYFSASKGEFLKVSEMHPIHASNAAAQLLRDSRTWATDAGHGPIFVPTVWMMRQPLFLALVSRANVVREEAATTCIACGKPCSERHEDPYALALEGKSEIITIHGGHCLQQRIDAV
jgi:hypothetical protein